MTSLAPAPISPLALVKPPYDRMAQINTSWRPTIWPEAGIAMVWTLGGAYMEEELECVRHRPPGLPLFISLPKPAQLRGLVPVLEWLPRLLPRAVLPYGISLTGNTIRVLLTSTRHRFPVEFCEYMRRRGLLPDALRAEVGQIAELSTRTRSVSQLCKHMYLSRRTLGRHFEVAKVPPPSHWLQILRLLHITLRLQREKVAVFKAAIQGGYPDGFTMSNQMKRLTGRRPVDVRDSLGWEWVVESWIRTEVERGGFCNDRYRAAVRVYLREDTSYG